MRMFFHSHVIPWASAFSCELPTLFLFVACSIPCVDALIAQDVAHSRISITISKSGLVGEENVRHNHTLQAQTERSNSLMRREGTSEEAANMANASSPPSSKTRRGILLPPAPPLDKRGRPSHGNEDEQPASNELLARGKARKVQTTRHGQQKRENQHAKAAKGWQFRGPTPYPLLQDPRWTHAEKTAEFERIIEKLHLEFFMKKEMRHSQLKRARQRFYETLADYTKLTGKHRPENFNFVELPLLAREEIAELEEEEEEEQKVKKAPTHQQQDCSGNPEVINVPNDLPQRSDACKACMANQSCSSVATVNVTYTYHPGDEQCRCLQRWVDHCFGDSGICNDQCFEDVINSNLPCCDVNPQEKCISSGTPAGVGGTPAEDGFSTLEKNSVRRSSGPAPSSSGPAPSPAERDLGYHGFWLAPILEQRVGAPAPGVINGPTACQVAIPDNLGDGNCDGGAYNTAACNYDGGDCCSSTCRPALHRCGQSGYQCQGQRQAVLVNNDFQCDRGKVGDFTTFYEGLRDKLTTGTAMHTQTQCSHLTAEEHSNVAQAFNIGVELGHYSGVTQASAVKGGPELYFACDLWSNSMGDDWFGTLITHELGHSAGYSHPTYDTMTYPSECEDIGSKYCDGHCKEWISACDSHAHFGSESCGFAGLGCKTTCVHSDYCFSLPERLTECFGYQKVHSRGEESHQSVSTFTSFINGVASWFGFGGAQQPSLAMATVFMMCTIWSLT